MIAGSYLWAARHGAGPEAIGPLRERFDTILTFPPDVALKHAEYSDPRGVACVQRWCWCDAIFMAPPVWIELSQATGDWRYAEYAKKEFAATTDYLFDPEEHLYYRDSRFFERRGPGGEKVFWSRGLRSTGRRALRGHAVLWRRRVSLSSHSRCRSQLAVGEVEPSGVNIGSPAEKFLAVNAAKMQKQSWAQRHCVDARIEK